MPECVQYINDTFGQLMKCTSSPRPQWLDSGTIDFMKFAVALGKSPGHGPDKTRRAYNFLPKHTVEYDLKAIERKIIHKLEDRCEV